MSDNQTTQPNTVQTVLPGSDGEKRLQKRFGTDDRAERFYEKSMENSLTDRMQEFLQDRQFGAIGLVRKNQFPSVVPRFGSRGSFHVEDEETVLWTETTADSIQITDDLIEGRYATLTTVDW